MKSMKFILGSLHEDDPPTSEGQNGFHGHAGCLATGTRILRSNIEYFQNYNVYELQNRHIHTTRPHGHVTQFFEK